MTDTLLAAPSTPFPNGPFPVPHGRGRWRLTLHRRQFTNTSWNSTLVTELLNARSRRLERTLNDAARLTFTMDGRSEAASYVGELTHDVVAWRWDDFNGRDVPMFRGIVMHSQDTISEQVHTVNFTCLDYFSMLSRRFVTRRLDYAQVDQDDIVSSLVANAQTQLTASGASLSPGGYLPLTISRLAGNSQPRPISTRLRDRTYAGSTEYGKAISQLSAVVDGFDFDVVPGWATTESWRSALYDHFRVFYPSQGQARDDPVLEFGGAVSSLTRSVNSGEYANFIRNLGNNEASEADAPQLFSERWSPDVNDVTRVPVGVWMDGINSSDVTVQSTLDSGAQGELNRRSVLVPGYSLSLASGAYRYGAIEMGDSVPVIIRSGRLDVNTRLRVVGLTYAISDDGDEEVSLGVGRALTTLADLMQAGREDINALARR
jgi:hypothetical protein